MPPKVRIPKEDILATGLQLLREKGPGAVNARSIAAGLGCSTQPIFSNYATMEQLQADLLAEAYRLYDRRIQTAMTSGQYPPYKAAGMEYIRFAREEKELFRLLFMRDRTGEPPQEEDSQTMQIIRIIMEQGKMSEQAARRFHGEMWIFVHGIATMMATGYLQPQEETVSAMLTDIYQGQMCYRMEEQE